MTTAPNRPVSTGLTVSQLFSVPRIRTQDQSIFMKFKYKKYESEDLL